MECVTLNTLTWAHADRHLMPSGFLTAWVLATDGERPDRYEFPICTIVLHFPEVLLSLNTLYLGIQ
jgi:hypothetical protein